MKLSTYQLYVNLGIDEPKKSSGKPFFRKPKKVIPTRYYKKCHTEMSNGKCQNDLEYK